MVPWTDREDALICRLREQGWNDDDIAAKLPHRTVVAVKRRVAHLLALGRIASYRAPWSAEEDDLICELYAAKKSLADIAMHFGQRTPAALVQRAHQLRREGRIASSSAGASPAKRWTPGEEALIVHLRERDASLKEIAARLPHRTQRAITARVNQLIEDEEIERSAGSPQSHRPWSREEDQLVALMRSADKTIAEMAAALGRTHASVNRRIAERVRKGELPLVRVLGKADGRSRE